MKQQESFIIIPLLQFKKLRMGQYRERCTFWNNVPNVVRPLAASESLETCHPESKAPPNDPLYFSWIDTNFPWKGGMYDFSGKANFSPYPGNWHSMVMA